MCKDFIKDYKIHSNKDWSDAFNNYLKRDYGYYERDPHIERLSMYTDECKKIYDLYERASKLKGDKLKEFKEDNYYDLFFRLDPLGTLDNFYHFHFRNEFFQLPLGNLTRNEIKALTFLLYGAQNTPNGMTVAHISDYLTFTGKNPRTNRPTSKNLQKVFDRVIDFLNEQFFYINPPRNSNESIELDDIDVAFGVSLDEKKERFYETKRNRSSRSRISRTQFRAEERELKELSKSPQRAKLFNNVEVKNARIFIEVNPDLLWFFSTEHGNFTYLEGYEIAQLHARAAIITHLLTCRFRDSGKIYLTRKQFCDIYGVKNYQVENNKELNDFLDGTFKIALEELNEFYSINLFRQRRDSDKRVNSHFILFFNKEGLEYYIERYKKENNLDYLLGDIDTTAEEIKEFLLDRGIGFIDREVDEATMQRIETAAIAQAFRERSHIIREQTKREKANNENARVHASKRERKNSLISIRDHLKDMFRNSPNIELSKLIIDIETRISSFNEISLATLDEFYRSTIKKIKNIAFGVFETFPESSFIRY